MGMYQNSMTLSTNILSFIFTFISYLLNSHVKQHNLSYKVVSFIFEKIRM